ncbi:MAG: OprO/OprP family phosphate-selective porin [Alphaproteobacteria bacterium]
MKIKLFTILTIFSVVYNNIVFASEAELQAQIKALESKISRLEKLLDKNTKADQQVVSETPVTPVAQITQVEEKSKAINNAVTIKMKPSPKFETIDGSYKFAFSGLLQTDYVNYIKNQSTHNDGAYIKNARLGVNGIINNDWFYLLENNFAGNRSKIVNAIISYNGFKPFSISAGQFYEKFGFDNMISPKNTTFMESAFVSIFAPSKRLGIGLNTYGQNWTANLGINSNSQAYNISNNNDEFKTISSKVTFAPLNDNNKVIHLGASGIFGKPKRSDSVYKIVAGTESSISSSLIDSGQIKNIKNIKIAGIEGMAQYNSFSLQAEYAFNDLTGKISSIKNHKAAYIQAAWILTGESRQYDLAGSNFGGVSPLRPLNINEGGLGAWEIATRYNYLDLGKNNSNFGGKLGNIGFALNWYPNDYIKFMSNYIIVNSKHNNKVKKNPNLVMLRAQFAF